MQAPLSTSAESNGPAHRDRKRPAKNGQKTQPRGVRQKNARTVSCPGICCIQVEVAYFFAGGTSVQLPCATSAAMPMDSPSVGWGWMVLPMSTASAPISMAKATSAAMPMHGIFHAFGAFWYRPHVNDIDYSTLEQAVSLLLWTGLPALLCAYLRPRRASCFGVTRAFAANASSTTANVPMCTTSLVWRAMRACRPSPNLWSWP